MESITIKQNKRSKKLEINVKHFLSVENTEELHSSFQNNIDNNKQIALHLQSIENIDISGIQLIYALRKEAQKKNIEFELKFEADKEITALLQKTGFEKFLLTYNKS